MDRRSLLSIVLGILVSFLYEGDANPTHRIVNGTRAAEGEFPYLVELRSFYREFVCEGTILTPEWILTAGHCVEGIYTIVYGTNKLYVATDVVPDNSARVKNWFPHPNFTFTADGVPIYDIGLLQLETPIRLNGTALAIKLPEANATLPFHRQGVLSGWGVNETYGVSPPYLQKVNLELLTDQECNEQINGFSGDESFNPIHHLCTKDYYNGQCYGDGGSPFVINGTQYGIVSWSFKPCGIVPGVYSRIINPDYHNWIKEVTNV